MHLSSRACWLSGTVLCGRFPSVLSCQAGGRKPSPKCIKALQDGATEPEQEQLCEQPGVSLQLRRQE